MSSKTDVEPMNTQRLTGAILLSKIFEAYETCTFINDEACIDLLWFTVAKDMFYNACMLVDDKRSIMELKLELDLDEYYSSIGEKTLERHFKQSFKRIVSLLGGYMLKAKNLITAGRVYVFKDCISENCCYNTKSVDISYIAMIRDVYDRISFVLGAIFSNYIGIFGSKDGVSTYYSEDGNNLILNPIEMDNNEIIAKVKKQLIDAGYIDNYYTPKGKIEPDKFIEMVSELFKALK